MDGPGEHYAKWIMLSQKKTSTIWFHLYVESNAQTELTSKIQKLLDSKMTAIAGERLGVEGSRKTERGLMDMDNSVVTAQGSGFKGDK